LVFFFFPRFCEPAGRPPLERRRLFSFPQGPIPVVFIPPFGRQGRPYGRAAVFQFCHFLLPHLTPLFRLLSPQFLDAVAFVIQPFSCFDDFSLFFLGLLEEASQPVLTELATAPSFFHNGKSSVRFFPPHPLLAFTRSLIFLALCFFLQISGGGGLLFFLPPPVQFFLKPTFSPLSFPPLICSFRWVRDLRSHYYERFGPGLCFFFLLPPSTLFFPEDSTFSFLNFFFRRTLSSASRVPPPPIFSMPPSLFS